jgi:hypothetical protein
MLDPGPCGAPTAAAEFQHGRHGEGLTHPQALEKGKFPDRGYILVPVKAFQEFPRQDGDVLAPDPRIKEYCQEFLVRQGRRTLPAEPFPGPPLLRKGQGTGNPRAAAAGTIPDFVSSLHIRVPMVIVHTHTKGAKRGFCFDPEAKK